MFSLAQLDQCIVASMNYDEFRVCLMESTSTSDGGETTPQPMTVTSVTGPTASIAPVTTPTTLTLPTPTTTQPTTCKMTYKRR